MKLAAHQKLVIAGSLWDTHGRLTVINRFKDGLSAHTQHQCWGARYEYLTPRIHVPEQDNQDIDLFTRYIASFKETEVCAISRHTEMLLFVIICFNDEAVEVFIKSLTHPVHNYLERGKTTVLPMYMIALLEKLHYFYFIHHLQGH